jgi:hypothetical protein
MENVRVPGAKLNYFEKLDFENIVIDKTGRILGNGWSISKAIIGHIPPSALFTPV